MQVNQSICQIDEQLSTRIDTTSANVLCVNDTLRSRFKHFKAFLNRILHQSLSLLLFICRLNIVSRNRRVVWRYFLPEKTSIKNTLRHRRRDKEINLSFAVITLGKQFNLEIRIELCVN